MSNLLEQGAQPPRKYTAYTTPSRISICPLCGGRKSPEAKRCVTCYSTIPRGPRKIVPARSVKRAPIAQPSDITIRYIPLTLGQVAIIDSSRYDEIAKFHWYAVKLRDCNKYYARTGGFRQYSETGKPNISLHQFLMGTETQQVDHIDGNGLNNRMSNLRFATDGQNAKNRGLRSDSTSGFIGVSRIRENDRWMTDQKRSQNLRSWKVQICIDGRKLFLGRYRDKQQAATIRDIASVMYFGAFARLNFPENLPKYQNIAASFESIGLRDLMGYFAQQIARF